ncbi:MAG TPA: membrane protein insertion efficiency factor YidD [Candidatus Rifleibacterium sp.]|nr:membrane protein insertion efficiency factor YidD [Candidatus Rifleibacterium sp.]HPT47898.1 membrane protein insertion efficiency factor YidD [Candidatus Rifleibacterium sp.]
MNDELHCSLPASLSLKLIRIYQRFLSPLIGDVCRFTPSCSRYTYQAIEKYGLLKGGIMGAWRICRCNPFCRGGDDPVR